ncbi:hypothetical protein [Streptomyces sp. WM6386]|uniref:hypothetical protein n=1 Tax=Streptomyces sp. WM6386 TaxID=1415558 RepID=UPI0006198A3C|nr:hypothetical protein [Streptomyces sp. WM6386]KKD09021.1 hypothetical protein TN53_04405 [Streptomyces sp. WM6386]
MDDAQAAFHLDRGSTGFCPFDDLSVPEVDLRACRTAWYAAGRAARGRGMGFGDRKYPQNFHCATLDDHAGTHFALFHAHHPLIAFVHEQRSWYTEFVDPPAWAAVLGDHGFTVLSASRLLLPIRKADTSALTAAEREQIRHWQRDTVGEVLFNSWD